MPQVKVHHNDRARLQSTACGADAHFSICSPKSGMCPRVVLASHKWCPAAPVGSIPSVVACGYCAHHHPVRLCRPLDHDVPLYASTCHIDVLRRAAASESGSAVTRYLRRAAASARARGAAIRAGPRRAAPRRAAGCSRRVAVEHRESVRRAPLRTRLEARGVDALRDGGVRLRRRRWRQRDKAGDDEAAEECSSSSSKSRAAPASCMGLSSSSSSLSSGTRALSRPGASARCDGVSCSTTVARPRTVSACITSTASASTHRHALFGRHRAQRAHHRVGARRLARSVMPVRRRSTRG